METTKPYLLNCLRVQCVQMLLLVSSAIDSSMTLSRLVFDEFVEVTFPDPDEALQLVLKVLIARKLYGKLLALMLEETVETEGKREPSPETLHLQRKLRRRFDAVLRTEIAYTVRRLLPADVKHLYTGAQAFRALAQDDDSLPEERFKVNSKKGGVFLSEFFTFGSLEEISLSADAFADKKWKCPICEEEFPLSVIDAVLHLDDCDKDADIKDEAEPSNEETVRRDPSQKAYFCKECNKELYLSLPEIFKHRKSHQVAKTRESS